MKHFTGGEGVAESIPLSMIICIIIIAHLFFVKKNHTKNVFILKQTVEEDKFFCHPSSLHSSTANL